MTSSFLDMLLAGSPALALDAKQFLAARALPAATQGGAFSLGEGTLDDFEFSLSGDLFALPELRATVSGSSEAHVEGPPAPATLATWLLPDSSQPPIEPLGVASTQLRRWKKPVQADGEHDTDAEDTDGELAEADAPEAEGGYDSDFSFGAVLRSLDAATPPVDAQAGLAAAPAAAPRGRRPRARAGAGAGDARRFTEEEHEQLVRAVAENRGRPADARSPNGILWTVINLRVMRGEYGPQLQRRVANKKSKVLSKRWFQKGDRGDYPNRGRVVR